MYSRREVALLLAAALPKDRPAAGGLEVVRLGSDAAARARARRNDPALVAYVLEAAEWTQARVQEVRLLNPDHELKELYVQFLKETYGYQIQRLTAAYGIEASSFTELASLDWRRFDERRSRTDDDQFLGWLAEARFRAAVEAIKREDAAHPVVSPYLHAGVPESVREAAASTVDVLWLSQELAAPAGKKVVVVRWRPD